ncbi:MAG: type II toxin-antitoxin system Phd/YefM family antitoxin [Proteobacteria bacterium]|nr:type II toxin-antitoxin system Phd/YefM family antitoxin [Pseudomonadota bacterium]
MARRPHPTKRSATHRRQNPKAPPKRRASGTWQLQAARANLSDVVNAAARAPQHITRNGRPVAVVLSAEEYRRLAKPRQSLVEFFQQSPWAEAMAAGDISEAFFERDRDPIRDIDL